MRLPDARDFRAHLSGNHQSDHFVIADERPEGMFESSRSVFLDEEMAKPRRAVAGNEGQRKQPPFADGYESQQA